MPMFRKKPVVIEAMQYTGDAMTAYDISQWAHAGRSPAANAIVVNHGTHLTVRTLEGDMTALPGDWIIKGVKGEFYPCKPDIFAATYEPADGQAQQDDRSDWCRINGCSHKNAGSPVWETQPAQQDAMPSPDKLAHLLKSIGWQPVHDMQFENLRDVMPTISVMFRSARSKAKLDTLLAGRKGNFEASDVGAPALDDSCQASLDANKVDIDYERGRFWHKNCVNHFGGVMKEIKREPKQSLLECGHCGARAYYPVGGIGRICARAQQGGQS